MLILRIKQLNLNIINDATDLMFKPKALAVHADGKSTLFMRMKWYPTISYKGFCAMCWSSLETVSGDGEMEGS